MRISKLRVHCSQVGLLMTHLRNNKPLTPWEQNKLQEYLDREDELPPSYQSHFLHMARKMAHYDPKAISDTAKSALIEIYAWNEYGKMPMSQFNSTVSIEKGQFAEGESIKLLSKIDNRQYEKNEKRYRNKYLTGMPDIIYKVRGKKRVIDVKTPIDLVSFLKHIDQNISYEYFFQLQCYMALVGADEGEICFCLVNLPPETTKKQIRMLMAKSFLAGNDNEKTDSIVAEFKKSMYFDDISIKRRVIRFKVKADPELMQEVYRRIDIGRDWLKKLMKAHIFGKKNAQTFSYLFPYSPSPLQRGEIQRKLNDYSLCIGGEYSEQEEQPTSSSS